MPRVISVNPGPQAVQIFGTLTEHPLTRRLESAMAPQMREAIRLTLIDAIEDARRDQAFPFRTGRAYRAMLAGCRAFGTRFNDLRGHILGPSYIVAHQKGTEIVPSSSEQLAVPLPAALKPDGSPKLPGPRSWTLLGSFIYKSKRTGKAYIARKNFEGQLTLLYVFVDAVQLRKHKGFMTIAWEKELPRLYDRWGQVFMAAIADLAIVDDFVAAGAAAGRKITR